MLQKQTNWATAESLIYSNSRLINSFFHRHPLGGAAGPQSVSQSVRMTVTDGAAVPVLLKFASRPIFHAGALCWVNLNNLALRHSPALNCSDKHVKPAASLSPPHSLPPPPLRGLKVTASSGENHCWLLRARKQGGLQQFYRKTTTTTKKSCSVLAAWSLRERRFALWNDTKQHCIMEATPSNKKKRRRMLKFYNYILLACNFQATFAQQNEPHSRRALKNWFT